MIPVVAGRAPREAPATPVRRRAVVVTAMMLFATTAVVLVALGGSGSTVFVVRDGEAVVRHERPVRVGERFALHHTHSVTGRPVVETFSVLDASTLAIEELWFDRHGANLPTGPETIDGFTTTYLEQDGAYRVLHHGRPIGELPLVVGSESVDHVVEFEDGTRVHLLDITDRWSPVTLGAERRGWLEGLRGGRR